MIHNILCYIYYTLVSISKYVFVDWVLTIRERIKVNNLRNGSRVFSLD